LSIFAYKGLCIESWFRIKAWEAIPKYGSVKGENSHFAKQHDKSKWTLITITKTWTKPMEILMLNSLIMI